MRRRFIFDDRDLPQDQPHAVGPQCVAESLGIGPFSALRKGKIAVTEGPSILPGPVFCVIPDVESFLIAPRLQHHDGGGNCGFLHFPKLLQCLLLGVPAVGGHPRTKGPLGRQNSSSGFAGVGFQQLRGCSGVDRRLIEYAASRADRK